MGEEEKLNLEVDFSNDEEDPEEVSRRLEAHEAKKREYSKARKAREAATFTLMRMMEPSALDAIRKEFFSREDSVGLAEYLYVFEKHLLSGKVRHSEAEKREFTSVMYELFKDVDVNGDGDMEWEELTKFIVEKANMLSGSNVLTGIAHYNDASSLLDPGASTRRKNEFSRMCPMPQLGMFAALEDHSTNVHVFNMRSGVEVNTFSAEG